MLALKPKADTVALAFGFQEVAVPVLISKSSGASEVIKHALKVDFWDTEGMADKIVAVLRHAPLGQTLRRHGVIDIRRLTWDDAAGRCERVYEDVVASMNPAR